MYKDLFFEYVKKDLNGKIPSKITFNVSTRTESIKFDEYFAKKYKLNELLFFNKDVYIEENIIIKESYFYKVNNMIYLNVNTDFNEDDSNNTLLYSIIMYFSTNNIKELYEMYDYINDYFKISK